jgi:hypothetical protein
MIKPIYFPFTYVPQWVAQTLAACFGQFTVYQPSGRKIPSEMQSWMEANVMEVRVPVRTEDDVLTRTAKEFRAFVGLHEGSKNLKTAVLWGRQGAIPCFGESAVSRIISDLKKSSPTASAEADFDPLFCAQIFLDFAQEFDRQSAELKRDFGVNDRLSRELLKEINGRNEDGIPDTPLNAEIRIEDPAEYMAQERLQAWLRLFMVDPVDSGLMVTSSPAVFNHLIEKIPAAQKVIQSEAVPVTKANDGSAVLWRNSVLKQLQQLLENRQAAAKISSVDLPLPQDRRSNVRLTLYLVAGQSAADIFARIFDDQNLEPLKPHENAETTNTLIGLISRQPGNI